MEMDRTGWWKRHGPTVLVLGVAFAITFLIRTLWNIPLFEQYGTSYFFAGGSDSFYHWRASEYIILNHRNLIFDPLLKYPVGAINPRVPLFDWMNAVFGILFAPFFGGSTSAAGMFSLELAAPLWAALSVFPLYLIGKEVSSQRMGLIATLIWPFLVGNIDSSTFGYANYLSFYTFFILVMIYAQLRTIRAAGSRRWVTSYRHPRDILRGIRNYLYYETGAIRWAVFTGVTFGIVILTWQGYTFLVALVVAFLVIQMVIERLRRVDSFGLYFTTWIVGLVGFPLAFPYYYVQGDYHIWFLEPVLIYFGALLVLLPFLLLRDHPWVISIPTLFATALAAVAALAIEAPNQFSDIITGQGYFVKTLIYSTVAEAQAPSVDSLIISYGVVTFFLAFAGLAFVAYAIARKRFERRHLFFFLFGAISIYLPLSAAKFFYLGSAAFSLLPAEGVSRILDIGGYPTLRRNVASLSDRRSQLGAFRRSFKVRHVLVMLLVVGIVLPNVWYGIDGGIPFNTKDGYDLQVYDSLPPPLRVSPANASSFYLGAAGGDIDTPNQYDEAGYDWLATQDTNLAEPQRPALISWWDYGFQTIAEGDHPAVADNFQNGIDPSGNFLLAQNESLAIGVLATTLLSAEAERTGMPYLPNALNDILAADGVNLRTLHTLLANTSADIPLVEAYPARYLPVNPSTITADNAMYDAVSYFLATTLSLSGVAKVYDDVQAYTGWSIRYAMVDTRLIPFSGSSTGIYYAPADLTGRVIDAGGNPQAYFTVSIVGSDGNTYLEGEQPAGVTAVSYNINYTSAFYNSMIYHIFFGYDEQEVGQGTGIPWEEESGASDPLEPGWMLQHFQVVYRTGYACNTPNATSGSSCFYATNVPTAEMIQSKENGTADNSPDTMFSDGGEAILEYYPGQTVTGVVSLPDGRPIPNVRVTVDDAWGIPHMTTMTAADGSYSLVLPPGNDVINVTSGSLDPITQQGATLLEQYNVTVSNAYGLSYDAPTLNLPIVVKPSTVQGTLSWDEADAGGPSAVPIVGATVVLYGHNVTKLTTTSDASGTFAIRDVPPSTYNVSLLYGGMNISEPSIAPGPGSTYNETLTVSSGTIRGNVTGLDGKPVAKATVVASGPDGKVATSVANSTGFYTLVALPPGNYSVEATLASSGESSQPTAADLSGLGANVTLNLTAAPVRPVAVQVLLDGAPAANVPVRFTEIVPIVSPTAKPANNTTAPAAPSQTTANSTVALTDADGVANAVLPAANYSVYALGLNGSTYYAGFWSGPIGPGSPAVPTIDLTPAAELYGQGNATANASVTSPTEVIAYDASGHETWGYTNTSGQYALWLPRGEYTIQTALVSASESGYAHVDLTGTTKLNIAAAPANPATNRVVDNATGLPIAGAVFDYTIPLFGATVPAVSNAQGNVTALVISGPPPGGGIAPDVCINITAAGYEPRDACGIPDGALAGLSVFRLNATSLVTSVDATGLPSGVPVTVNLTADSPGARSVSATGIAPFSVSVLPGSYLVSAWAPGTGSGRYLPAESNALFTLAPAAAAPKVTVPMVYQIPVRGTISLPSGITLSEVRVSLQGPSMNTSVTGTAFATRFFAATGPYDYEIVSTLSSTLLGWAGQGSLTVSTAGTISSTLTLPERATTFNGTVAVPGGGALAGPAEMTFVSPSGFAFPAAVEGGTYGVTLPVNATYRALLNVTAQFVQDNATVVEALAIPSTSDTCVVVPLGTDCDFGLVGTLVDLPVDGRIYLPNSPLPLAGTVLFEGPSPGTAMTELSTSANGSFSTTLAPGSYTVYANASGGGYALLTSVNVGLSTNDTFDLGLVAGWRATLSVLPPSDGASIGAVTATVRSISGYTFLWTDLPVHAPYPLLLPVGVYQVAVSAPSAPYGIATNATANATVSLLGGNAAATLPLAEDLLRAVDVTILGPTGPGIDLPPSGGTVRLGYSIRNTGNAPVNVSLAVTPSIWNSTISPGNLTLGTGMLNSTASGSFEVVVPAGTAFVHAPILISADLRGTSTQIGQSLIPAPVPILPKLGITLGTSSSIGPVVTPTKDTLTLYALNTGNLAESVALGIVDGARLAQLGWNATLESSGSPITAPLSLADAGNSSVTVVLNATHGYAQPPGSVTVQALVVNRTAGEATSTITINVPVISVTVNSTTIAVSGPNVGSPSTTPDWLVPLLVFVPTMALVGILLFQRWWSTRRWVR